jgi:peptidoglycan/xylan/chitin deacetylase (PgdA/CDA1 family)
LPVEPYHFSFFIMVFFRNLFFKILYKLGFGKLLLNYNRRRKRVPVLVFHKIIPEYDQIWPGIHPQLFEEVILMLKKHYTIRPLSDLYLFPGSVQTLEKACFITFDDGYKDYLGYAYPILKRQNVPSALFILPFQITNKGHIWTSTIVFFIKHYAFSEVVEFFRQQRVMIRYRDIKDGFKLNLDITKYLCGMGQTERMQIVNDLRQKFLDDKRVIEDELLSFEELRMFDPELVTVASHSLTHPSFSNEHNLDFIESELKESKRLIEQETGLEVGAFAFPFASYNELSLTLSKKLYKICFTAINNFVDLHQLKEDANYRYNLPRFNVHHDSAEEVFFLINGFHRRLKR